MLTSALLFCSSCLEICLILSCLNDLLCPFSLLYIILPLCSHFQPFFIALCLFFSCPHFILRDKAPGQRECDSSIDNINKCIRDIEQASLAAVSQNLASRDDISLEVSSRQKMTRRFALTATCTCLCLRLFVLCLFIDFSSVSFTVSLLFSFSSPCVTLCVSLIRCESVIGDFN